MPKGIGYGSGSHKLGSFFGGAHKAAGRAVRGMYGIGRAAPRAQMARRKAQPRLKAAARKRAAGRGR